MLSHRHNRLLSLLVLLGGSACASDSRAARAPARDGERVEIDAPAVTGAAPVATLVAQQGDSEARRVTPKPRLLTEAEQNIADAIAFAPSTMERFVVAARNKRLLLDVGRLDLEKKPDAQQLALVRRVASRAGPLSHVSFVRVRGSWGMEVDSIAGYDVWNGRVVAVLVPSPPADSLLRKGAPLLGVATRMPVPADTTAPDTPAPNPPAAAAAAPSATAAPAPGVNAPAGTTPGGNAPSAACVRDSVPPALSARVALVRDSLVRWVTDSLKPPYGPTSKLAVRGDTASGCFGPWRAVVVVTTRTAAFDWSEERTLLVAPDGKAVTGRLRDLRLRIHESLVGFDADGDGIDELATRGLAVRMGAQSVLKLDPAARRFSRLASGFAWETR